MPIERQPIRSNSDPDDPHPWYEIEWDEEGRKFKINNDSDGGTGIDLDDAELELTAGDISEDGVIAVTLDGTLDYFQADDLPPELRAHLAFWDADTSTMTLLDFQEA